MGLKIPAAPWRAGLPREFSAGEAAAAPWLPGRAPLLHPQSCPAHGAFGIPARRGGEGTPPFPREGRLWRTLSVVPQTSGTRKEPALSPLCSPCPYGREGMRLVAALRLINAGLPARACLYFLPVLDSFQGGGKKSSFKKKIIPFQLLLSSDIMGVI